ncbi:hypothetical protein [Streptomyces mirabilis]|uniref:hypothetical protein n=1 Tax=Streptomyces mirabilis TaxID=68239 RepID=UPI002E33C2C5|nr:hypothetical protein [Streptomyces mirabilis]
MTFTPDNRALAAGTADGVVTWNFHADRERPLLPMPGEGVNSVEFDPTGAYVLSWGAAGLALWRTDSPAPANGGPHRPLITFPVETPAVTDIRLDPREEVLRYREGSQAGVVRTLSLHGLISPAWRKKARSDAAFDADGQSAEPAVRPAVRAVAADGTVYIAVNTRDGILVTRQGAHPVAHVVGRWSEGPAAIDPAGRTVVTAEGVLIDVATGSRRQGLQGEDLLPTRSSARADATWPPPTPGGASPRGTTADSTGSSSWQSPTPPSSGPPRLSRPTARCWPRKPGRRLGPRVGDGVPATGGSDPVDR